MRRISSTKWTATCANDWFGCWRGVAANDVGDPVRALRRLVVRDYDRRCQAVTQDMGKNAEEALAGDILPLAGACRFLEKNAASLLRPRKVPLRQCPLWLMGQRDTVHHRPRGV